MRIDLIPTGSNPPEELNVVIEVPTGGEPVKYEFDKASGALFVDRILHTPMRYPANYGFVPHTLSPDGDPLDALVIARSPFIPGCVVRARPIGVLNLEDEHGGDEKLICVPVDTTFPYYSDVGERGDLPSIVLQQIEHFFTHYKDLESEKWVRVGNWGDAAEARQVTIEAIERYKADKEAGDRRPDAAVVGVSAAAAWRWCLAAGLVAFACSWGFGRIPGLVACGDTGGLGPIIAFELARTPAEVTALFGAEPCRSTLAAAQRSGLWLDALAFIPSYTAFLCLAAWAAGQGYATAAIGASLIAGTCDEIEGVLLWAILNALPGTQPLLAALFWIVRIKFLLLGLTTLAIAALLLLRRRPRLSEWSVLRIVGALGIAYGAVGALRGFFAGPSSAMMAGFAAAWFILLLVALVGAWLAPARRPAAPTPPSA